MSTLIKLVYIPFDLSSTKKHIKKSLPGFEFLKETEDSFVIQTRISESAMISFDQFVFHLILLSGNRRYTTVCIITESLGKRAIQCLIRKRALRSVVAQIKSISR